MERYSSEGDCDSRQELNRLFFKLNIQAEQMFLRPGPRENVSKCRPLCTDSSRSAVQSLLIEAIVALILGGARSFRTLLRAPKRASRRRETGLYFSGSGSS
jgi:hypothetical protein